MGEEDPRVEVNAPPSVAPTVTAAEVPPVEATQDVAEATATAAEVPPVEATQDVAEAKTMTPPPATAAAPPPPADDSKALVVMEKVAEPVTPPSVEKSQNHGGSIDRDAALARIETEKRLSLIKAWEDSEKTKVENRAFKKLSAIGSWENSKKASVEAQLKKIEEKLERKKAEFAEKMKNKIAVIHKEAEEKRAIVEAKRMEEMFKADEMAAKYRATGHPPKKPLGCFGG